MGCNVDIENGTIICTENSSGYVPGHEIRCNFTECASGMGLAGRGSCNGEPRNPDCPKFESEADMLARWEVESAQEGDT